MTAPLRFLLFICCLKELVGPCSGSAGPVFINPANQNVLPQPSIQQSFVTQTVYGFLDFTTTIGNTVMIFSPQSASQDASKKETPTVNAIIETKPAATLEKNTQNQIKPSKIETEIFENKIIGSKIVVVGESNKKTQESVISSKIEVVEGLSIKEQKPTLISKVEVITEAPKPTSLVSSRVEVYEETTSVVPTPPAPIFSSVVEIKSEDEPAVIIGNNIGEPEYDFLSRQPSEVVEETFKVINLKPSSKFSLKPRPSSLKNKPNSITKRGDNLHPTGLVTKLGGTVVKDGITTVHETSVIGTYISGKYAQVLQSTSHITNNHKHKINPSSSLRILKTAAPSIGKSNKLNRHLDPTPALSINEETLLVAENPIIQNQVKSTRKPNSSSSFKRFKNRARESESEEVDAEELRKRNRSQNSRSFKQHIPHREKIGRPKSQIPTVSSVSSDVVPSTASYGAGKRYNTRKSKQNRPTTTTSPESGFTRRGYKPKVQASTVDLSASGTSLYKFKLNRSPGRWQYKTTPKPRVTIRKQVEDEHEQETTATTPNGLQELSPPANDIIAPQSRSDDVDSLIGSESVASLIDDDTSLENKIDKQFQLETIKVEISTPPDFKDIYYEIATIKSPYTFQAGSVKNTRYITVTSTFERSLEPTQEINPSGSSLEPLTENILASTSIYDKDNYFLDSSIGTLPPLYLASDVETPPLNTIIDTFSTTQTMLKTNVLPIIKGNNTSTKTLIQTYLITRMVTATKTLPPKEAYQFNPSKTLNEFNSYLDEAGSELHLELEFGDQNDQDDLNGALKRVLPGDLDLAIIGSDFNFSEVETTKVNRPEVIKPKPTIREQPNTPVYSPEQLQQLAIFRLLNPGAAPQNQLVTASKPVFKLETVYESHVIPVINGVNTIYSTLSKIIGTVTKTEYELVTNTIPSLPLPPPVHVNPLFPQVQQQFAFTSSPVIQTTVITQTSSKILKLTFGAKTAYTTIFSTKVIPTVITSYMTASVAVPQQAAYPGYYPAPYPQFPFVG